MFKMARSMSVKQMETEGLIDSGPAEKKPRLFSSFSTPAETMDQVKRQAIKETEQTEKGEDAAPAIVCVQPSDADRARMKAMFDVLDLDRSKSISKAELATGVRLLGMNPTKAEVDQLWVDAGIEDENGCIDFDDYVRILMKSKWASIEQEKMRLTAAFNVFDAEGKGYIEAEDLKRVLCTLGEDPFGEEECSRFFEKMDLDKDGKVTYKEFVEEMCDEAYVI